MAANQKQGLSSENDNVPMTSPKIREPRTTTDSFEDALEVYGSSGILSGFAGELDLDAIAGLSDLEIEDCSIRGIALGSEPTPPQTVLEIESSLLADVDFSGWSILSVNASEIRNSKLSGIAVAQSVNDTSFVDCKLDNCLIRFASLKHVEFDGCQLLDADFHGSKLAEVRFEQSKITGVGFDRCEIENVDVRGCDLSEIGDPRTLGGVVVDSSQVFQVSLALAVRAGLIVRD